MCRNKRIYTYIRLSYKLTKLRRQTQCDYYFFFVNSKRKLHIFFSVQWSYLWINTFCWEMLKVYDGKRRNIFDWYFVINLHTRSFYSLLSLLVTKPITATNTGSKHDVWLYGIIVAIQCERLCWYVEIFNGLSVSMRHLQNAHTALFKIT